MNVEVSEPRQIFLRAIRRGKGVVGPQLAGVDHMEPLKESFGVLPNVLRQSRPGNHPTFDHRQG